MKSRFWHIQLFQLLPEFGTSYGHPERYVNTEYLAYFLFQIESTEISENIFHCSVITICFSGMPIIKFSGIVWLNYYLLHLMTQSYIMYIEFVLLLFKKWFNQHPKTGLSGFRTVIFRTLFLSGFQMLWPPFCIPKRTIYPVFEWSKLA
jgi:hypothetical protein